MPAQIIQGLFGAFGGNRQQPAHEEKKDWSKSKSWSKSRGHKSRGKGHHKGGKKH